MIKNQSLRKKLLTWHRKINQRTMPWKGLKDPYKIWLSEIILQQTRVDQGEKYYLNLIKTYPTIQDLADARDEDVFRLWQGLGYYSRCRNLLHTARFIAAEWHGEFPGEYQQIRALKGVGDYTAAAIASFAFGLPYAVVDGNVIRVLSRYFGLQQEADSASGKRYFQELAQQCLDITSPAEYNQAMMDLGATICKPRLPICAQCPLKRDCVALKTNRLAELPLKRKRTKVLAVNLYFSLYESSTHLLITKRTKASIWKDLYAFPESEHPPEHGIPIPEKFEQLLSHRKVSGHFFRFEIHKKSALPEFPGSLWVAKKNLRDYAFPRLILSFLEKYDYL